MTTQRRFRSGLGTVGAAAVLLIGGSGGAVATTYHNSYAPDGGAHSWSETGGLHVDITDAKCDGHASYVNYYRVNVSGEQRLDNGSGCQTNVRKPAASTDTSWTYSYVTMTMACTNYSPGGDSCDTAFR